MYINAKVVREVTHTRDRVASLVQGYVACTANVNIADEDDYSDFTDALLNILLDYTREVDNG